MGAELEKGRNLLAETSGGQIRKGPKPLATISIWTLSPASLNMRARATLLGVVLLLCISTLKKYQHSLTEYHRQMNDKSTQSCCNF